MATHSSTLALKIPWTEELGAGYYPYGHQTYLGSGSKHRTSIPACNGSWALGYLERTEYLFFGQKLKKTPIIVFKWSKTKAVLKDREGAKRNGQKYLQEGGSSIL